MQTGIQYPCKSLQTDILNSKPRSVQLLYKYFATGSLLCKHFIPNEPIKMIRNWYPIRTIWHGPWTQQVVQTKCKPVPDSYKMFVDFGTQTYDRLQVCANQTGSWICVSFRCSIYSESKSMHQKSLTQHSNFNYSLEWAKACQKDTRNYVQTFGVQTNFMTVQTVCAPEVGTHN